MGDNKDDEIPFDMLKQKEKEDMLNANIPLDELEEDLTNANIHFDKVDLKKEYNLEEAKEASKKLALKIKNNRSKTPVRSKSVLKSTHVIREYKRLNTKKRIRVNIKYDFGAVKQKLLKIPNGKQALKELITDRLKADRLRFNSKESKEAFENAVEELGFREQLNNVKIEIVSSKEKKSKAVSDKKLNKLATKPMKKKSISNQVRSSRKKEQGRIQNRRASF